MDNKIGTMTWEACKTCKNQAGPRGCNSGSCIEDLLNLDALNNGDTRDIECSYYVPVQGCD